MFSHGNGHRTGRRVSGNREPRGINDASLPVGRKVQNIILAARHHH